MQTAPEPTHKKRKFNWLMFLFGLIGLIIFLLPSIYSAWTTNQQAHDLNKYKQAVAKNPIAKESLLAYNEFIQQYQGHVPTKRYYEEAERVGIKSGSIMGYLSIPAIKLKNMPMAYGDTDTTLSKGLGTLPFTSLPIGSSNSLAAITGHSGMSNQIFFDNIKFLKKGDVIQLYSFGTKLSYEVTTKKVIDPNSPTATENFYLQPGKDLIALMTCTPVFINSHRLIVYAKRIPNKVADLKPTPYRAFWSVEHIYFIVVGLILLLIALAIWSVNRKKKKNEQAAQQ